MEQSILSRLDGKLRNKIYRAVFQWSHVTIAALNFPRAPTETVRRGIPGVLQCCAEMRKEAIQLFYETAVFQLECAGWDGSKDSSSCLSWIHFWLDNVGSQNYCHLRTVVIKLGSHIEYSNQQDVLPLHQRKIMQDVLSLVPQIAGLTDRVPARALSISFSWETQHKVARVHSTTRQCWFRAEALRIFAQSSEAPRPFVSPEQHALSNSPVEDIFSACLVGNGRAILILLVHGIWNHVFCHTGSVATNGNLLRGMDPLQNEFTALDGNGNLSRGIDSLQNAFAALDGGGPGKALSILTDAFRGYPLSTGDYDAALGKRIQI